AEEIAMQLSGRKSLPKRNAMVDANIKRVFAPMPPHPFSSETQQGKGDVKWLYPGPTYLLGTKNENYQPGMSLAEMKKLLPMTDHHG
ncbi:hypothetical protein ACI3QN_12895, partial [Propionibacterium freudenreichii]|uniref:hypothetical protein n=1 Tax=Propionibacterium freudenreichii TaxID=1744 RepID=UPI00385212EE